MTTLIEKMALARIAELEVERDALRVERDQWERNHEALQDKFDCNKTCGCAYDSADALCGYHSPRVIAAEARALAAEAAIKSALGCLDDPTGIIRIENMRNAAEHLRRALAQPKEPTAGLLVSRERLREQIASDPDLETEARSLAQPKVTP